eukprot:CAMPEP_0113723906 /NCGR_PEP_ID=MMETSP0038_2-20120614/38738_1 /TAXON_ID=2898 /ORGANISM="Cryptomonas paramecium" /LENGTH=367 /DNA_ID=CAMNT_0000653657 /DNA_START=196 /DNA_END=1299 /DNA_ORIENTATION=+ /assembly_acc=CAM_ASM_000170
MITRSTSLSAHKASILSSTPGPKKREVSRNRCFQEAVELNEKVLPKSKKQKKNIHLTQVDCEPNGRPAEESPYSPPANWREIYNLIKEMRKERIAPVDWAGSEILGIDPNSGKLNQYHALIALMLSSQTKDQVVAEAMSNLRQRGLTIDSVLGMSDADLNACIRKVGFHNNKTKFIKAATEIIKNRYEGNLPPTVAGLCELPGVGPKMAYILARVAFGRVEGIGVDTHMHRILNVLGWVHSRTPEQTRKQLEAWLPREEWAEVNQLLVGLGQSLQQPPLRAGLLRLCINLFQAEEALELVVRLGGSLDAGEGEPCLVHAARPQALPLPPVVAVAPERTLAAFSTLHPARRRLPDLLSAPIMEATVPG